MHSEPALTVASVTAAVAAAIALAVAFGLKLSDDQVVAILGFVGVVGPIVAGLVTRTKVTPAP